MNWNNIEPSVEKLQLNVVSLMERILTLSNDNNKLPQAPTTFLSALEMAKNPCYNVVVCGEVKKGKSSFLNAIVGQDILPVNNEIATSQVFRISNSNNESFALYFTDGSSQSISRDEVSRYGSQVDADLYGEPLFKNKTLDYIQVNVPVKFLPNGVSLVDTPGLGALYKSHELITQNYMSKASAVIFVIDPERPIVKTEADFIRKILEVTSNILFVMTKIDMYSEEACNDILLRNKEALALLFAEKKLEAPQIYPVSSQALQKVSTVKIEALRNSNLKNSKFLEVKEQLLFLIYKGVGLLRTGLSLKEAANQASRLKTVIEDILSTTLAENQQVQAELSAQKIALQNKLQAEWGENSAKRKHITDEIYSICNSTTSRVQQLVNTSGKIYTQYELKINALESLEEAAELARTMPISVVSDIKAQWEYIASDIQDKVIALISQVGADMDSVSYGDVDYNTNAISIRELSFKEKLLCYRNQYFTATWASSLGVGAVGTGVGIGILAAPVFAPVAAAIGIAGAIWGFLSGKRDTKEKALNQNKATFKQELQKLLNKMYVEFLHVPEDGSKSKSLVQEFIDTLKKSSEEAVQDIFQKKKDEMSKQLADLNNQAKLTTEEKKKEVLIWSDLKMTIDKLISELKSNINLRNEIAKQMGVK